MFKTRGWVVYYSEVKLGASKQLQVGPTCQDNGLQGTGKFKGISYAGNIGRESNTRGGCRSASHEAPEEMLCRKGHVQV